MIEILSKTNANDLDSSTYSMIEPPVFRNILKISKNWSRFLLIKESWGTPRHLENIDITDLALQRISRNLNLADSPTKALQAASLISRENTRLDSLRNVLQHQIDIGNTALAISLIRSLEDGPTRCKILALLSSSQIDSGNINNALEFAKLITDDNMRMSICQRISFNQAALGNMQPVIECAKMIYSQNETWRFFATISYQLIQEGNTRTTSQVLALISDEGFRWSSIYRISETLLNIPNVTQKLGLASIEFCKSLMRFPTMIVNNLY